MKKNCLCTYFLLCTLLPCATLMRVSVKDSGGKEVLLYGGSYALVIGNSDYTGGWDDLPTVRKDLKLVSNALRAKGFLVETHLDLNKGGMEKAFEEFIGRYGTGETARRNRLVFYYAGHGETLKPLYGAAVGYLVPRDAPLKSNRSEFKSKALNLERINGWARNLDALHALFLFDSCFSGALFALSKAAPALITHSTSKPVRQFITSGSEEETVPDDGQFAALFVGALNGRGDLNKDSYVTGSELGSYLRGAVINYSRDAQHPQYGKIRDRHLDQGDFVFELPKVEKGALYPAPVLGSASVSVQVPVVDYAGFYQRLGKLEQDLVTAKKEQSFSSLASVQETYNHLSQQPGANAVLLARVGKDLERAFLELHEYEKEMRMQTVQDSKQAQIEELLRKVRKIPASDYKANLDGYEQLLKLAPGNQAFKNKVAFYSQKKREALAESGSKGKVDTPYEVHQIYKNSLDMEFVLIPAGSSIIGAKKQEPNERPLHVAKISRSFFIGRYEVTQGQWGAVMNGNPSSFKTCGQNCPVEQVNWGEVQEFINRLNVREGCPVPNTALKIETSGLHSLPPGCYRLPTEAEWEYVARSGSFYTYHWGKTFDDAYVWYKGNSGSSTHRVGTKQPNKWNVFDMSGNVWEWVLDFYEPEFYKRASSIDPVNTLATPHRSYRGGSWLNDPSHLRPTFRSGNVPTYHDSVLGFRVLRTR
jgi:formylglycine-generating enzyme required for sulfatase activity